MKNTPDTNKRRELIILISLMITAIFTVTAIFIYSGAQNSLMIRINITEDGYLYAETVADNISRRTYKLFWETDGGSLKNEDGSNPSYYCYSELGENISWLPEDPDGYRYTCATVKVRLYEERYLDLLDISEYEEIASLTLTLAHDPKTGSPEISQVPRIFGNPLREDAGTDWAEIYTLYENTYPDNNYMVLRYRTGNKISSSDIICWETNAAPVSKAVFSAVPPYAPSKGSSNKMLLKKTDTICFNISGFGDLFFEDSVIDESGTANIKISAWLWGGSEKRQQTFFNFSVKK